MDLATYEALKFDLAGLLRGLRRHCARPGMAEPEALHDLFSRLAEDRFNLAVIGRFSRGKTSLMNAILGTDLLPVGVLPVTSVITLVSYGSEPKAVLHYRGTSLFMDIPLAELAEHITERGNPGNRRGIRAAEIQLPAEFLRRGLTFVDTPGLGSAILANTRTTEAFLPEADALLLVSSHDSPIAAEEEAILRQAVAMRRALFVVLNKQDLVDPATRAASLAHVAALMRAIGDDVGRVFSVSARDGLSAKRAGDASALAASGLPELERALVDFLLQQRQSHFLTGLCDRIAPLLAAPGTPPALAARLGDIRARVAADDGPRSDTAAVSAPSEVLLPGCEICRAIADAVFDALAQAQATLAAERAAQADLARRGGFCGLHLGQFRRLAATREVATAFAPVLHAQAAALRRLDACDPGAAAAIAALPANGATCPICAVARKAEVAAIARLVKAQAAGSGGAGGWHRSALCLPHLSPLLLAAPARERAALVAAQAALMERLAEDAERFALQQDARRRDRSSKEDLAASERAALVLRDHPDAQYDHAPDHPPARGNHS